MRTRQELETTNNRYVYNRLRKTILELDAEIRCSRCGYHRGENETNRWYGSFSFHCEIGKIHYPNWKLVSKNKKQWMDKGLKKEELWRNPDAFKFVI